MVRRFKDGEFNLCIELGNDSMNTQEAIAESLEQLVAVLRNGPLLKSDDVHKIYDLNGNKVGFYCVEGLQKRP